MDQIIGPSNRILEVNLSDRSHRIVHISDKTGGNLSAARDWD